MKFMKGYAGKILFVNLTDSSFRSEPVPPDWGPLFIGGRGLGIRLLLDNLKPGTDPLSPENVLILATGPLTGTLAPCTGKYVVFSKSPLTGGVLESYSSGELAVQLKLAGYDALVITGKCPELSVLWIEDDRVTVRPVPELKGKGCFESETYLRQNVGFEAGVAVIGPAGENMVKYASIGSDYFRQAARGGGGAVFGSKNLKGIVVRGTGRIEVADWKNLVAKYSEDVRRAFESRLATARKKYGTPLTLDITNASGMLPTLNFQHGTMEEARGNLDAEAVRKLVVKDRGCYCCMTPCSKFIKFQAAAEQKCLEGPEYETLGMIGSNLGISDLSAVGDLNLACDDLGMDTISAGAVLGFIMECIDRGYLSEDEVGYEIRFGKKKDLIPFLNAIANRTGYGNQAAEGVRYLAECIGSKSVDFAMHVKGLEFPAYDPRAGFGAGLAYAVSPRGACHRRAWPPAIEIIGGIDRFSYEGKAELVKKMFDENNFLHSLLVCDFPAKFIPLTVEDYLKYFYYVVGSEIENFTLSEFGDRIEAMFRVFNIREGFTSVDDTLPERILNEGLKSGAAKGKYITKDGLNMMIQEYYELRGWDHEGRPTAETLARLKIDKELNAGE